MTCEQEITDALSKLVDINFAPRLFQNRNSNFIKVEKLGDALEVTLDFTQADFHPNPKGSYYTSPSFRYAGSAVTGSARERIAVQLEKKGFEVTVKDLEVDYSDGKQTVVREVPETEINLSRSKENIGHIPKITFTVPDTIDSLIAIQSIFSNAVEKSATMHANEMAKTLEQVDIKQRKKLFDKAIKDAGLDTFISGKSR